MIFSYYSNQWVPHIVHPKWWQIWKRAELAYRDLNVRTMHFIPEDEGGVLIAASNDHWDSPGGRLLLRLMGREAGMLQLERDSLPSDPSEYLTLRGSVTNELRYSEPGRQK